LFIQNGGWFPVAVFLYWRAVFNYSNDIARFAFAAKQITFSGASIVMR